MDADLPALTINKTNASMMRLTVKKLETQDFSLPSEQIILAFVLFYSQGQAASGGSWSLWLCFLKTQDGLRPFVKSNLIIMQSTATIGTFSYVSNHITVLRGERHLGRSPQYYSFLLVT